VELVFYYGGTAVLVDATGATLWTSDADEEFGGELLTVDDADDVLDYLESAGYIDDPDDVEVIESDAEGNRTTPDDDEEGDDLDDDDDDEEDEEDDDEEDPY
jgi:hypothetical protein